MDKLVDSFLPGENPLLIQKWTNQSFAYDPEAAFITGKCSFLIYVLTLVSNEGAVIVFFSRKANIRTCKRFICIFYKRLSNRELLDCKNEVYLEENNVQLDS